MIIINSTSQLVNFCHSIKDKEFITIDTEFSRDKTYYPKLCLIQVSDCSQAVIIDTLSPELDIKPFSDILDNTDILKVFHSGRQDLEIFYLLFGKLPSSVFDTQIAASVCGFGESVAYETLVQQILKQQLNKPQRFTDWSKRPLSKLQIEYALGDVVYLCDIYKYLVDFLNSKSRISWIKEEMDSLLDPKNYNIVADDAWKKIKLKFSSKRTAFIVKEIAKERELLAQKLNIPRLYVLSDPAIIEIAAVMPKDINELMNLRFINDVPAKFIETIISVIKKISLIPSQEIPNLLNQDIYQYKKDSSIIHLFKVLLKIKAQEYNVAEKMIATTDDLRNILINKDTEEIQKMNLMNGWRYEILGKYLNDLKLGKIALTVENNKLKIIRNEK